MKPNKSLNYYYANEKIFVNPIDNARFFVMKNYEIGMHKQLFFEINIIIRGKGVHYIEDNEIEATVGDVFIIPPEVEHGYTGGEGFDVYHIILNNKFMQKNMVDLQMLDGFSVLFNVEPILRAKGNKSLHLKLSDEQLESISDILDERVNREGNFYVNPTEAFLSTASALILITRLCHIYAENRVTEERHECHDSAFLSALALIHERYYDKLGINELARTAKLSKSSFMRRFMEICKTTPAQYIIEKRVEIAENMLVNTSLPISDIAERIGFYDAAYFSKIFIKKKGISPSKYRKNVSDGKNQ